MKKPVYMYNEIEDVAKFRVFLRKVLYPYTTRFTDELYHNINNPSVSIVSDESNISYIISLPKNMKVDDITIRQWIYTSLYNILQNYQQELRNITPNELQYISYLINFKNSNLIYLLFTSIYIEEYNTIYLTL